MLQIDKMSFEAKILDKNFPPELISAILNYPGALWWRREAAFPVGSVCSARLDTLPCAGADGMLLSSSKLLSVFLLGLLYQILSFIA